MIGDLGNAESLRPGCGAVRRAFSREKASGRIVRAVDGQDSDGDTYEILDAHFTATEDTIYGKPNPKYVAKELDWYLSQSLNVNDMKGEIPEIWQRVSGSNGEVNSNYGWCVFSRENGSQFDCAFNELLRDPNSRRAVMIYNRPDMHADQSFMGAQDFMCTNTVQCFIRKHSIRIDVESNTPFDDDYGPHIPMLHYSVFMRSNDAVFGYKNDLAWHKYVRDLMVTRLRVHYPWLGFAPIVWNAASLHVYRRHFDLIE
jgi:thymidylate synthase